MNLIALLVLIKGLVAHCHFEHELIFFIVFYLSEFSLMISFDDELFVLLVFDAIIILNLWRVNKVVRLVEG